MKPPKMADECIPVVSGKIAAVVTYLEMNNAPEPDPWAKEQSKLELLDLGHIEPSDYKTLFRKIGSDWLWFSRLRMTDSELAATLASPSLRIFGLYEKGNRSTVIGMLELNWNEPDNVEVAFLGVIPEMIGRGGGRYLMSHAIDMFRRSSAKRIWLHTCTLDHPKVLDFYQKAGFRPFKREIEVTDDPRLDGTLRRETAPYIPIIE
jgi:GNAT superfamily N-acetyltransferase